MLEKLRKRLQQHTPQRLDHVALPEAAVLMPIVERPAPTLLFTRRASHLTTHRGQVAFPGGKREPDDADLYATALREAEEEIALAPGLVQPLGRLSDVISLHGIRVTPWVGIIPPDLPLVADPAELDAILKSRSATFRRPAHPYRCDYRRWRRPLCAQLSRRWSRDLGIICHDVGGAVGRGFWNGD